MLKFDIQDTSSPEITDFLANLSSTPRRVLLLDYDGTLAPFSIIRHQATPYPGIPELIDRIRNSANTRVVVVTGRPASEALELLGLKGIEVWGCHGLSRLLPDGTYEIPMLDEEAVSRISEANELLLQEGLADFLEFKPAATAIHWRGFAEQANSVADKVQRVWSALSSRDGIKLLQFDQGMEIRISGSNKGDAVRAILAETHGQHAAIAYLGDDCTDEDAFEALQEGKGLSVLVSTEHRPTLASTWITPSEGVIAFLSDWLTACGGAS